MRIEEWRAEIDSIDNELLRLLNRRARLAVGEGASQSATSHEAARAPDVLERACRVNAGPLDELAVAKIFRRIIHETQHAAAAHARKGWTGVETHHHEEAANGVKK